MKPHHALNIDLPETDDDDYQQVDFDDDEYFNRFLEKTRQSRWKIYRPGALSWGRWRKWDGAIAEQFPIRNWFHNEFLHFFTRVGWRVSERVRRTKWFFLHRVVPRHQYHVLRPATLKPGYHDPDERMLHALMEELRCFYENGAPHIEWEADEHHSMVHKEMTEIYNWWVNEYPHQEENLEQTHPYPERPDDIPDTLLWTMDEEFQDHPAVVESRRVARERREIEDGWEAKEEEMLIRLIKIRKTLWYP